MRDQAENHDNVLNHMKTDERGPQKTFRYVGFAGPNTGCWPKDPEHFHPNANYLDPTSGRPCNTGNICRDPYEDAGVNALGYGGKVTHGNFRTAGSIWAAAGTPVKVAVFTDGVRNVEVRVLNPDEVEAKSATAGHHDASGSTSNMEPLTLEFTAEQEGYHQLSAWLTDSDRESTRAYVKVEYEALAESGKF